MERIPHIAKPTPRQLERLAALAPDVVWDAGHEYGIALLERYLSFEIARFGEDRLELIVDIQPELYSMLGAGARPARECVCVEHGVVGLLFF